MDTSNKILELFFATRQRVGRQLVDKRDSRGRPVTGPWRDSRKTETGRDWSYREVDPAMVKRHVDGTLLYRSERARLQTYGVSEDGMSVWTAIDLDVTAGGAHSDQPQHFATTEDAQAAAVRIFEEARRIGVIDWFEITKSAGIRVWVFFSTPIPAVDASAFGRLLVTRAGLHAATEVFPNTLRACAAPVLLPYAGVAKEGRQVILNRETLQPMSCGDFATAALITRADATSVLAIVEQAVATGEVTRLSATHERDRMVVEAVSDQEAERRWKAILIGCARLRMIVEHAEAGRPLDYFDWSTRLLPHLRSLGEWGHAEFHRLSAFDPRYNAAECEDKFDSLDGAPTRCEKMGCSLDPHRDCGLPAKNVSPAYFGHQGKGTAERPALEQFMSTPKYPVADEAVYQGLLGEIVGIVAPHTEADPLAVLVSLIVGFGSVVGRRPFFQIESTSHHTNLYAVIVGRSAVGRKGTSLNNALAFLKEADREWSAQRVLAGLSSGEGLIHAVRDAVERSEPVREKGRVVEYQSIICDDGVSDKRLLVAEGEFAKVLKVIQREGNSLSPILRQAWDSGDLRVMTKTAQTATGAHISIIGHITQDELLRDLDNTEVANGLANRFLWIAAKRSKLLPEGGKLRSLYLTPQYEQLRGAVQFARGVDEMNRDETAREMWCAAYPALTREETGLFGALIARGAPIVVRLSMIYALVDKSAVVRQEHLEAALALWQYAEESARYVFGNALGDPIADTILAALRGRPDGMTQTDIRDLFGRNQRSTSYLTRLETLEQQGLVRRQAEETGGKPATRWFAI